MEVGGGDLPEILLSASCLLISLFSCFCCCCCCSSVLGCLLLRLFSLVRCGCYCLDTGCLDCYDESNVGDVAEQVIGAAGVAVAPEYGVRFYT